MYNQNSQNGNLHFYFVTFLDQEPLFGNGIQDIGNFIILTLTFLES